MAARHSRFLIWVTLFLGARPVACLSHIREGEHGDVVVGRLGRLSSRNEEHRVWEVGSGSAEVVPHDIEGETRPFHLHFHHAINRECPVKPEVSKRM